MAIFEARSERMDAVEKKIAALEELHFTRSKTIVALQDKVKELELRLEQVEGHGGHGGIPSTPNPSSDGSVSGFLASFVKETPSEESRMLRVATSRSEQDPLILAGVKRGHEPPGVDDEARPTKLLTFFSMFVDYEFDDFKVLMFPRESVYTAFWVFPMLSHSFFFKLVSFKMVILNICAIALQGVFLNAMEKYVNRFPSFDGTPSLCTYGINVGNETERKGPLGVTIAVDKSNVESDYSMVIIRNAMVGIMQKLGFSNEDVSTVGPVEYGTEDFTCRSVCVLYFLIGIAKQISDSYNVLKLLWFLPNKNLHPWVECDDPRETGHARFWNAMGKKELDHIKFKVTWMPTWFKIICVLHQSVVMWLVWRCTWLGTSFLMETAGIIDLILNSLALTFILEIDETLFKVFGSELSKHVMNTIEAFRFEPDHGRPSDDGFDAEKFQERIAKKYKEELNGNFFEYCLRKWARVGRLLVKMLVVLLAWWFLTMAFFFTNCSYNGQRIDGMGADLFWDAIFGRWASKNITYYGSPDIVSCVPYPSLTGCGAMSSWRPS